MQSYNACGPVMSPVAASTEPSQRASARATVLTPEPSMARFLSTALARAGISVLGITQDPAQCVSLTVTSVPDIFIVDSYGGVAETLPVIRSVMVALPQTCVILLTAYISNQERNLLSHAGVCAVIHKPCSLAGLVSDIREIYHSYQEAMEDDSGESEE